DEALEQRDAMAELGQQDGRRLARDATTDDGDFEAGSHRQPIFDSWQAVCAGIRVSSATGGPLAINPPNSAQARVISDEQAKELARRRAEGLKDEATTVDWPSVRRELRRAAAAR